MALANLPSTTARLVKVQGDYKPWNLPGGPVNDVFRYDVTVQRPIDFLLMDLLPIWAGGPTATVTATSTVVRKVVWSVVMLDVSRSMACPAVGQCTCTTKDRTGPCDKSVSKFASLMQGLRAYLETFDLERDQILIVPYNIRARAFTTAEAMAAIEAFREQNPWLEPADNQADGVIDYMQAVFDPSSMTNICDALETGYDRLEQLLTAQAVPGHEHVEWVLFTDGAPTAGRYEFDDVNPTGGLPQWPPNSNRYDYGFNNIDWVNAGNETHVGPSLLAQYGAWEIQDQTGNSYISPPDGNSPDPGSVVNCTGGPSSPLPVASDAQKLSVSNQTFGSCLNSLRSHIPGQPQLQFGGEYRKNPLPGQPTMADFSELHYICAISMADQARRGPFNSTRGRGRFSVVGVGEPAAATVSPFQNADDGEARHDVFLSRLALDPDQFNHIGVYQDANLDPPQFSYDGYQDFTQAGVNDPDLRGQYYPRPNAGELRNLFRTIARKVALRYIQ